MQADVALRLADDDCSTSDEELLERICERDVTALEALYDRHGGHAYSLAHRVLADRGMAEEVTQDAFMSVWRRAATYKPGAGRLRPWLLAIVHHRAIDRTRRIREKQPLAALDEAWMVQAGDDIFADVYRGLQREQIRAAMQQLPAEQRQAIELSYFGGRTFSEIAGMIGVPAGTVKSRVRLGLAKLKLLLDEELA